MAVYNNSQIQLRTDTEANWNSNNPVLAEGEIAISYNKRDLKAGTGANWKNTTYMIANNPTVQNANTNAANALTQAATAASNAQTALTTANQAIAMASTASTRRSNSTLLPEYSGARFTITGEFVTKNRNTTFSCLYPMAEFELSIDNFNMEPDNSNEIIFKFFAASNCRIRSSRMTTGLESVTKDNKLYTVTKGDGIAVFNPELEVITFEPGTFVTIKLVDTWLLEVEAIMTNK